MEYLTEEERQLLIQVINAQQVFVLSRNAHRAARLAALREKLEGVDRRIAVETLGAPLPND